MMRLVILGVFLLPVLACSTLVTNDPPREYSPKDLSSSREGVVAYNPAGLTDLVQARRDDAYRKIVDFCGSRDYKISKEVTVTPDNSQAQKSLAMLGADEIRELHFICTKATTH